MVIYILYSQIKSDLPTISNVTNEIQKEIAVIQTGLLHRSFNPKSKAHHLFLLDLEAKIKKIQTRYPEVNFSE